MADFFEDLKRDLETATPGPWIHDSENSGEWGMNYSVQRRENRLDDVAEMVGSEEDARLIARAPQLAQLVLLLPEIREAMINHPPEVDNAKARQWDHVLARLDAAIAEVSQ